MPLTSHERRFCAPIGLHADATVVIIAVYRLP